MAPPSKKRSHDQMAGTENKNQKPYRPRPSNDSAPNQFVGSIKKRLRDATRLLEHQTDMPTDVRIQHERAIAGYKADLEDAYAEQHRQKMIRKYHKIRFFERQKATRLLKRLRKQQETEGESKELAKQIHRAEVDLNYTLYSPLDKKYVSLYVGLKADEIGLLESEKPPMWKEVEKCMEEDTLVRLRDGPGGRKTLAEVKRELKGKRKPKKGGREKVKNEDGTDSAGAYDNRRGRKGDKDKEADETEEKAGIDDGGFFED